MNDRGVTSGEYTTERGEISLSIELALGRSGAAPADKRERPPTSPVEQTPAATQPERKWKPLRAVTGLELLSDVETGAPTLAALRQKLENDPSWRHPGGAGFVLMAVAVEPLDDIRAHIGAQAASTVLRELVDAVPFLLRARDRIYRTAPSELTLLLDATDDRGAEAARERLESTVQRVLANRGLPSIRLLGQLLDPSTIVVAA